MFQVASRRIFLEHFLCERRKAKERTTQEQTKREGRKGTLKNQTERKITQLTENEHISDIYLRRERKAKRK